MTKVILDDSSLEDIADAIRAKNGTATKYKPNQMATAVTNIPQGTDTSDATLDSNAEMLSGYTAYSNGVKYTGSIATKTSSDLQVSGATVTVPSGYYAYQASTSVSSGSASAPSTISGTSATVSTGTNTLTLSKTVSVTPTVTAGYISSGTATNSSVSLQASVTTKGSATITPTTTDQTISSGTYITGTQTIKGDSNLVAGNIKSGTTIFNVLGTYTGGGGSGKNIQAYIGQATTNNNTYTAMGVKIKVAKTGTYKVSWSGFRNTTSGTSGSQLYIDGTAYGTANTSFTNSYGQNTVLNNVSLTADKYVEIYARSRNASYYMGVSNLIIEEQ